MTTLGCTEVRELAPDLALGLLTGADRAAALAHLEGCRACRADVASLTGTVDEVLLLSPEADPPPGFDHRVLARLDTLWGKAAPAVDPGPAAPRPVRRSRGGVRMWGTGRRRWAVLAVATTIVVGLVIGAWGLVQPDRPRTLASADMRTGQGHVVGVVRLDRTDRGWVEVDVPQWRSLANYYDAPPGSTFWLSIELEDGSRMLTQLAAPHGSWRAPVRGDTDDVAIVAILDEQGRAWCFAHFMD